MTSSLSQMPPAEAYERLLQELRPLRRAVVAFSGGVDSSLLLAAAVDALGEGALGITLDTEVTPSFERRRADAVAALLGARHRRIEVALLSLPAFQANAPDRCYHCKRFLLGRLCEVAAAEGQAAIVEGSNGDDGADHRPGRRAVRELGIRSPLAALGLGKEQVRALAKFRGLPNWDAPACACLASRVPYGMPVTSDKVARVDRLESAVRALGFAIVRARDFGSLVKIELEPRELARAASPEIRVALIREGKEAGYAFVCLDLEGFRTGALNEVLSGGERETSETGEN